MNTQLDNVRMALAIVRHALLVADDYGKRDLWRIEHYLCRRAADVAAEEAQ